MTTEQDQGLSSVHSRLRDSVILHDGAVRTEQAESIRHSPLRVRDELESPSREPQPSKEPQWTLGQELSTFVEPGLQVEATHGGDSLSLRGLRVGHELDFGAVDSVSIRFADVRRTHPRGFQPRSVPPHLSAVVGDEVSAWPTIGALASGRVHRPAVGIVRPDDPPVPHVPRRVGKLQISIVKMPHPTLHQQDIRKQRTTGEGFEPPPGVNPEELRGIRVRVIRVLGKGNICDWIVFSRDDKPGRVFVGHIFWEDNGTTYFDTDVDRVVPDETRQDWETEGVREATEEELEEWREDEVGGLIEFLIEWGFFDDEEAAREFLEGLRNILEGIAEMTGIPLDLLRRLRDAGSVDDILLILIDYFGDDPTRLAELLPGILGWLLNAAISGITHIIEQFEKLRERGVRPEDLILLLLAMVGRSRRRDRGDDDRERREEDRERREDERRDDDETTPHQDREHRETQEVPDERPDRQRRPTGLKNPAKAALKEVLERFKNNRSPNQNAADVTQWPDYRWVDRRARTRRLIGGRENPTSAVARNVIARGYTVGDILALATAYQMIEQLCSGDNPSAGPRARYLFELASLMELE